MTEQPKLIAVKEDGEPKLLTYCLICKHPIKIRNPERYLYVNVEDTHAVIVIPCPCCGWRLYPIHVACVRKVLDNLYGVITP